MANNKIIRVENLHKSYGAVTAVKDLSFEVEEGEIFGMVGPNGAGKTTTIECIEGLRQPSHGHVQVLEMNPFQNGHTLRERIGIQLQESNLPHHLKVWEALDLFAAFYARAIDWSVLLEQLNLADKIDAYFDKLSGGQKQRLFIALSLVNDPELVFFDELTTGLDPQARRSMWDLVRSIRDRGKTVFLTTHFMEEAERLCDRVAILDQGKLVALDSPENLIRNLAIEHRVIFTTHQPFDAATLNSLKCVNRVQQNGERFVVFGNGERLVVELVNALNAKGCQFGELRVERPTLEDVFLALTGKEIRD
ncbi:MAG: ABC transporter ATP-binding protein [bacterium]